MDVRADARPAKRRRLSNVYDQQAQTASTSPRAKLHLSLMGSPEPLAESKRSDGSGANRANRACLLDGAHRSSSKDSLTKIEPELPECCYGMVRRGSITSNNTSTKLLTVVPRSYVTSPSASDAD
jgi:hypothetical protein